MTAHDQIRALLDELMGTSRNGDETKLSVKYYDPEVCKSYLLGCCPHDILTNTRMSLGDCPKIHNLALRADYERESADKNDFFCDLEALNHLRSFILHADRRKEKSKERLEDVQTNISAKKSKIQILSQKIEKELDRAERMGVHEDVEGSLKILEQVDTLKKLKMEATKDYNSAVAVTTTQLQTLKVCNVCCAHIGVTDNDERLAHHFGGRLHLGFIKIRETLQSLEDSVDDWRNKQRRSQNLPGPSVGSRSQDGGSELSSFKRRRESTSSDSSSS